MRRIVVDIQNSLFADAIVQTLRRFDPSFDVYLSESPDNTLEVCQMANANVLVMEVSSFFPWQFDKRILLKDAVKSELPDCKIVFIVDENSEKKTAEKVRQAKKDKLIDQFIYGSVSASYLAAIIDTL